MKNKMLYLNLNNKFSNFKQRIMQDKASPDYNLFHQWFSQNGGKSTKIQFPVKFGPTEYIGIEATASIKANQVILAIPKKLIITLSLVRASVLAPICEKYRILNDIDNEETDFHLLALYLIWQKQMGKQSFFYPYLQCIQMAETILDWSEEDVQKMREPTITQQYIHFIKKDFPEVFHVFVEISVEHPQLFKQPITWQMFIECYSMVMTRCFGWGLPETMLVPYADFFNHSSNGVNHYTFNRKLQESDHKDYVKKNQELNLSILGIDNSKKLPTSYARNKREQFIHRHKSILEKRKIFYDQTARINTEDTRKQLEVIQEQLLNEDFNIPLFPSSDSQDNDSEPDDVCGEDYKEHIFIKHVNKLVEKQIEPQFEEPKPYVNREFLDGVDFSWWNQENDEDTYFIVASSSELKKGTEIFNSYGRRSNRFLLVWYGFTLFKNKYDSIPFRILSDNIYEKTGKLLYVDNLISPYFNIGGQKFGYESLSEEYRLKKSRVCYKLMAFLRRKVIRKSEIFKDLYIKKLLTIHQIRNLDIQKQMLELYESILKHLIGLYDPFTDRPKISVSHRDYFCHLLLQSNKEILIVHNKGVKILKKLIENLQIGMSLNEAYKFEYLEEEKNQQCKVQNRKIILDYFKMLMKWKKQTKQAN